MREFNDARPYAFIEGRWIDMGGPAVQWISLGRNNRLLKIDLKSKEVF